MHLPLLHTLACALALMPLSVCAAAETPLPSPAAQPETTGALFAGQQTHPLSAAELAALRQKLSFAPGMPAEARERILLALSEAVRYPAGREQARVIIASARASYPIALADNLGAFGSGGHEGIVLAARMLSDTQQTASTLLHELCHARQNRNCPATCARETMACLLIQEAESKAIGWEWFLETGTPGDLMLGRFHAARLGFWREVARGERPQPNGLPPFSPAEGLSRPQLAEAREAWAQQMAMYETRARIIKGFITPLPAIDSDSFASYFVLASQLEYQQGYVQLILQQGQHPRAFREAARSDYALPLSTLKGNPFLCRADLEKACQGPLFRRQGDISELFAQAAQRCGEQADLCFTQACEQLMAGQSGGRLLAPRDIEAMIRCCKQASFHLGRGNSAALDRHVGELRRLSGNEGLPGAASLLK